MDGNSLIVDNNPETKQTTAKGCCASKCYGRRRKLKVTNFEDYYQKDSETIESVAVQFSSGNRSGLK